METETIWAVFYRPYTEEPDEDLTELIGLFKDENEARGYAQFFEDRENYPTFVEQWEVK